MQKFRLINIKLDFLKVLSLIFLIFALNSCDKGCVESDQFDTASTYVESKPIKDGITGDRYPSSTAAWHKTAFRSDGSGLILLVRGGWTSWDEGSNDYQLQTLPNCKMCAKKDGVSNCICATGENPTPEKDSMGNPKKDNQGNPIDCSTASNQNDASICSCTKQHGLTTDPNVYWISTNYQNKDETIKLADDQEACKYAGGYGLYVGLFGRDGNVIPNRFYQIYPTSEICDIARDASGRCFNSNGDQTKYLYKSPDNKVFVKDNSGANTIYHQSGEHYKLIINDNWYWDNYGGYQVDFIGGFLKAKDSGLLEYIVGTVEDSVLGNEVNGTRVGGAVNFLYNSIVKDSKFIRIVQLLLVVYVVLFGIGVLIGTVEISRKDLMSRIIKISLIIAFTTPTSWYFYNQIVVGFFKDGMDYLITIFMELSDQVMDQTTLTSIVNAQLDITTSTSYATRFSYIDFVIKKLLSINTSKKIWSLFLGEWFGILYIPVIYALIFAFLYIMLTAAFVYISALLRLVFVLCLGPIFMVTLLFNKTDEIFKRWISFMASQAIQIVCLFLVIYLFLIKIDVGFNDLLDFKACAETWSIGLTTFTGFMKSQANRSLPEWLMMFFKIATLLFLLKMIMEKIPGFAGQLVSVSGMKADNSSSFVADTNRSAFALAGSVLGMAGSAAKTALTSGVPLAVSSGVSAARFINRATGIGDSVYSVVQAIPFRGLTSRYRDHKIDNVIRDKQKEGKAKGLSGALLDNFVRSETFREINKQDSKSYRTNNIFGINNNEFILKRLNTKLVKEPLKDFIKNAAKEIKEKQGSNVPLDRDEMKEAIKSKVNEWAKKNSSISSDEFTKLLDEGSKSVKSVLKKESALTSYEAAKAFQGDKEGKARYLEHLEQEQIKKEQKSKESWEKGTISGAFNDAKNAFRAMQQNNAYNPDFARQNFLSKVKFEEEYKDSQKVDRGLGNFFFKSLTGRELPEHKIDSFLDKTAKQSFANRVYNRRTLSDNADDYRKLTIEKYFLNNGYKKDLENIDKKYKDKFKDAKKEEKEGLQKSKDNDLKKAEKKNADFKKSLQKLMKDSEEKARRDIKISLKRKLDEEKIKLKKDALEELISSNQKKLFLIGEFDKKLRSEETIKTINDLTNNLEGKISNLEKESGEKLNLKNRLELDRLKSEKEMLEILLKAELEKETVKVNKEKIVIQSLIEYEQKQRIKKLQEEILPTGLKEDKEYIEKRSQVISQLNRSGSEEIIREALNLSQIEKQNIAFTDYLKNKQAKEDPFEDELNLIKAELEIKIAEVGKEMDKIKEKQQKQEESKQKELKEKERSLEESEKQREIILLQEKKRDIERLEVEIIDIKSKLNDLEGQRNNKNDNESNKILDDKISGLQSKLQSIQNEIKSKK